MLTELFHRLIVLLSFINLNKINIIQPFGCSVDLKNLYSSERLKYSAMKHLDDREM